MDKLIVEAIGGTCPICGFNRMLMRYGSTYACFQFDACPKCGFGYGVEGCDDPMENEELWIKVLSLFENSLVTAGLPATVEGMLKANMSIPIEELEKKMTTVFQYSQEDILTAAVRLGMFDPNTGFELIGRGT